MAQFSRYNALSQLLDVAGSERQAGDRLLTDETGGLGSPIILNSGVLATITAFATPNLTVGGLTGQSAASVGTLISLRNAEKAGNNGVFRVNANSSATVNILTNASGYFPDGNTGSLIWEQYNAGIAASIGAVTLGIVTITGLQNMTANSVGGFITISGAASGANNGTFLITEFVSATSVKYANSAGVASDANNPAIAWVERLPYTLNDDLDLERSDRTYIKGVNYDQPVPSYTRPTLVGVNIPVNLSNIAGKTLDAHAKSINKGQFEWPVEVTLTNLYGAGTLKHADSSDTTGIPCFDAAPFTSDWTSCFVQVVDENTGDELEVQAGPQQGQRIFGQTYGGASSSPNSVEVRWYSCALSENIATSSTAYSWEKGASEAKTGTTSVTVVPGVSPASALTGLTGGGFVAGDIGTFLTITGSANAANNGTFVILSVQSGTAVTVSNAAAVAEGPTAAVTWLQKWMGSVTVVAGANGAMAITGLTAGGFVGGDVESWLVISGLANGANNGSFVIASVQSATAVTVQNHAAVSEGPTASVEWAQYAKTQPTVVNLVYGFNQRLDQLDQNAWRFPMVGGLVSDADLRQDIIDLQSTGGWADGTTNLSTYLTNTGSFYIFSTLPGGAGDTVVAALNALNQQIGIRDYTGPYLTDGQTITASLQALSDAINTASVVRTIERLAADINANTAHTLPGGITYVLDGTNNGKFLFLFWRGLLRDPGTVANGDDYQETSTTQFTPYSKIKSGDHITYMT